MGVWVINYEASNNANGLRSRRHEVTALYYWIACALYYCTAL